MLKILMILGASCVVLLLALGGIGFFLPADFVVERSVVIAAEREAIHPYVNTLNRWQEWSAWTKENYPKMEVSYSGPESGVGAKSSWTDPDNGNGTMTMTASDIESGIEYSLSFDGYDDPMECKISYSPDGDGVRVTIWSKGNIGGNPYLRYMGLMMDSLMGGDYESGLAKLKTIVESGDEGEVPAGA